MLADKGIRLPKSIYETVVCFDNSIAYSMANVKYISENFQNFSEKEKSSNEETERNDNVAAEISQQELLERIAALESQVKAMSAEQQNLKEQIETVNNFVSAITESQNFEQSMATIESMGKQVLDCGKAEFWCYDGAENKYFTNDENRGGRDWQIAKENMRIAAETKEAHIADGEAYIPIISNDKVAGILVASEKDGTFDKASLDKFSPNGQIANTIDLSLKKEFEHQGRITDELTRLKNRQGAKEYAANTMAHNVNAEKDMCLIMCDIDHFKSINDTYGHDAGDTVLKNVAGILQSGTRQGADSAFRWGGEEMVCVLNCDYDHAMDIAERLRQQIESTTHLVYNADKEPTNVSVTISMGVYQVKPDKEITQENAFSFFESQLKFADELAYKAKETGRNKVVGESDIIHEKVDEKESYSIFGIDNGVECKYYRDDNTDVNALVQRLADGNLTYPEISKNCTEISNSDFAEFEQSENNPPAFCAEINLSTKDIIGDEKPMELTVWDNDKIATISLDEAIQSIKENGTVNFDYQKFAASDYEQVITAGTIDKYGLDIDFGNIEGVVLKTSTENYIGGIDDNGHERRDNYSLSVNEVEIYYSEYRDSGALFRFENENPMEITIDEALEEIQNFLDEALNDPDKTVFIKYNSGREEYIDPNKLINEKAINNSEYLDFSKHLDEVYDDFMYHSSIFNNEHIEFVDKHGELPYDLNSADNREKVIEYINIQLDSGSNLTESQKETLSELKSQIDEIKEMESKLGIDEGDLKFIAEIKSADAWTNEVKKTLDEQGRNNPEI